MYMWCIVIYNVIYSSNKAHLNLTNLINLQHLIMSNTEILRKCTISWYVFVVAFFCNKSMFTRLDHFYLRRFTKWFVIHLNINMILFIWNRFLFSFVNYFCYYSCLRDLITYSNPLLLCNYHQNQRRISIWLSKKKLFV